MNKKSLFFLFVFSISSMLQAKDNIRLANGEWPPYLSANLYQHGFASDIVKEAFAAVNIDVEYGFFPWPRSFQYAKSGRGSSKELWHGSVVWVHSVERAKYFYYSEPVMSEQQVLFFLKTKVNNWSKIEDLQGIHIGGTSHTVYPVFEEAEKKKILTIERAGNYSVLFERLLSGRIDAIPLEKKVAAYFLRTNLTKEKRDLITFAPTIIQNRVFHLILSKKHQNNKALIELFNQGLNKIKLDGTYHKLEDDLSAGKYDRSFQN